MEEVVKEIEGQEAVAGLFEMRLRPDGTLDVMYSNNLIYLLKSNPKDEVKKAITECIDNLIENIAAGIDQVTKDAK